MLGAHEASHRLSYQCSQSCHREHVLSFEQNYQDALYHSVKCVVQLLHVKGEGVVEQGDVELSDFGFTGAVALCVCVNRDLREDTISSETGSYTVIHKSLLLQIFQYNVKLKVYLEAL